MCHSVTQHINWTQPFCWFPDLVELLSTSPYPWLIGMVRKITPALFTSTRTTDHFFYIYVLTVVSWIVYFHPLILFPLFSIAPCSLVDAHCPLNISLCKDKFWLFSISASNRIPFLQPHIHTFPSQISSVVSPFFLQKRPLGLSNIAQHLSVNCYINLRSLLNLNLLIWI